MFPNESSSLTLDTLFMRIKLASLWTSLMLLYIYADIFTFYRPGFINSIVDGNMGPFETTQFSLALAGVLMSIPAMMVAGSFLFSLKATRVLTIVSALLFTLVNVGNLVGETWIYYLMYGFVELTITIVIAVMAWRWRVS